MIEDECDAILIRGYPIFSTVNDNYLTGDWWEKTGIAARWTPETGWIYPNKREDER